MMAGLKKKNKRSKIKKTGTMRNTLIALIIIFIFAAVYFTVQKQKETEDILPVPVESEEKKESMTIKVFFGNSEQNLEALCEKVFPVERTIEKTEAVARAALEELLKGPTSDEKAMGYFTNLNKEGVKIQSLVIEDGTARVDFSEELEFQVGGSCRVAAIRAEIRETLKQFPTVENVEISINGRTEDILQP